MFSTLRTRFGIPGVISVIALVFAMLGGAYAANNSSGGGKATGSAKKRKTKSLTVAQVKKIAKQEAQKYANSNPGAPGANGANGKDGAPGTSGTAGQGGAAGKSVEVEAIEAEEFETRCEERGGAEVREEDKEEGEGIEVCNGSPWTAGGTLPADATQTGAWAVPTGATGPGNISNIPISFPIPLNTQIAATDIRAIQPGGTPPAECDDGEGEAPSAANPEADPGFLCIFAGELTNATIGIAANPCGTTLVCARRLNGTAAGASTAGARINLVSTAAGAVSGFGSFAVTG